MFGVVYVYDRIYQWFFEKTIGFFVEFYVSINLMNSNWKEKGTEERQKNNINGKREKFCGIVFASKRKEIN